LRQNESVMPGKDKFLAPPDDQYVRFVSNLQKKLQIAFQNNASNALSFFDLNGSETLRIDEFLFGVEFFTSGNRLKDALILFQELDTNRDGMLDEQEFEQLFFYNFKKDVIRNMDIGQVRESVCEEKMANYLQGGYNTYNKKPLEIYEML